MPTSHDQGISSRCRKNRLITGVGFCLLAMLALVFACGWLYAYVFHPWLRPRLEARELARLAALPYPDPHPDQAALLTFTEHMDGINIRTGWLPIHTIHSTDGEHSGSIVMHLTTRLDPAPRAEPDREVSITFASLGAARLPAADAMRHALTVTSGDSTVRISPDEYHMSLASMNETGPYRDFMMYDVPTTIIVEAANANDLTITIAGTPCPVPPETFETLRAFTATLKPGYTPPTP